MISVKRLSWLDPAVVEKWEAFVLNCPEAHFFHRPGWGRLIADVFQHPAWYLYAEREGQIIGVLPLSEVKSRLFGHSLVSVPFGVYAGVAANDPEAVAPLEREAMRLAKELRVDHLEVRNTVRRHGDWPLQDLYVTFRRDIYPEESTNLQAVPRKQRAMIRKGIKNGLIGELDDGVDRFFSLYAENTHRHGTPAMPKRWFQSLRNTFGSDCEVLTVVSPQGVPLSTVMSFYFRDEVLPYYAGDALIARELAANDFKYWDLMRRACLRGVKVFDFGRSKQGTGSFAFKKNWGFEPTQLNYEYQLYTRDTVPQNNPNNAKYQLMIKAWRRMPIGVANWLGPFIVRSLG